MLILKGFKFNDLELLIPKGLRACFLELRILKRLVKKPRRRKSCGAEAPHLQHRGGELQSEEKPGEGDGDWLDCDENPSRLRVNMEKGSIALAQR